MKSRRSPLKSRSKPMRRKKPMRGNLRRAPVPTEIKAAMDEVWSRLRFDPPNGSLRQSLIGPNAEANYKLLKRAMKPRKPLKKRGARSKREAKALAAFRIAVLERAMGRCERCRKREGTFENWLQAHHKRPRSRGGSHHSSNGAALCLNCHSAVHDHTAEDWRAWIVETAPKKK